MSFSIASHGQANAGRQRSMPQALLVIHSKLVGGADLNQVLFESESIAHAMGRPGRSQGTILSGSIWSLQFYVLFDEPAMLPSILPEGATYWNNLVVNLSVLATPLDQRTEREISIEFLGRMHQDQLDSLLQTGIEVDQSVIDFLKTEASVGLVQSLPGWDFLNRFGRGSPGLYRPSPAWPIDSRWEACVAASIFNLTRHWTGDTGVCLVFGDSVFYVGPDANLEALADYRQTERQRRRVAGE